MSVPRSAARRSGVWPTAATQIITSPANPRIRWIRSLRHRKVRKETGLFFVDSPLLVAEAHRQHAAFHTLVVTPKALAGDFAREAARLLLNQSVPVLEVTPELFAHLSGRGDAQGLGAVLHQRWGSLADHSAAGDLCWVAVDGAQYPGNLGTVLRTSDAAGGAGVILLGPSADPYDPIAVRASLGAVFSQRIVRATGVELLAWARTQGCLVVGTSPRAAIDYREANYRAPVVLLMGCEHSGLSAEMLAACDRVVRIPMMGRCNSLNLGIATGLMLYEVLAGAERREGGTSVSPPLPRQSS